MKIDVFFFPSHVVLVMGFLPEMREQARRVARARGSRQHFRPPHRRFLRPLRHRRPAARGSPRACQAQARHSQPLVSAGDLVSPRRRPLNSAIPTAPPSARRPNPPKDFLHPLAELLANPVTAFGGRAPVQLRRARAFPARHLGRDVSPPARRHQILPEIRLVGTHRIRPPPGVECLMDLDRARRRRRLRFADRIMDREVRTQALAVFLRMGPPKHRLASWLLAFRYRTLSGSVVLQGWRCGAARRRS